MHRNERRNRTDPLRILVVDDEADIRELLDLTLSRMGLVCDCAASIAEAQAFLEQQQYQLCLTDMRLPDGDGLSLVALIGEKYSALPVAVITAYGSTENAVAALKAGAFDYLAKPVALNDLRTLIKSALEVPQNVLTAALDHGGLIGHSAAMMQVRSVIDKLARSQAPVYISGESGSGKELAAKQIHQLSNRANAAFVPVNCGAIPENLVESEFFGYRKGAFTGADNDREGFFQAADGGTLFLDEVADLPLPMQVKLLRAIQEKRVRKVGCASEEDVDIRLICATHKNLKACVETGEFRQDLYYRLNVIELRMPPLRDRGEDVPLLIETILQRFSTNDKRMRISEEAEQMLASYQFPGNVRELENILERATALCCDQLITCDDLQLSPEMVNVGLSATDEGLQGCLDRVERQAILDALEKTRFNRTAAARLLGVTFRSLRYRMERLGIE
jgi:two-component system response regulator PilR (NtrC family)